MGEQSVTRDRPRVLAHRGASGHAWENSIAAFRAARELGADGVELDLHTTLDGALIVHHDPLIAGLGAIRSLNLESVRGVGLPNGETIPTLEEALNALTGLEVWVELKTLPASADQGLLFALDAARGTRCGVHSFDHRIVARLGRLHSTLRRGVLSVGYPMDPAAPMLAAGATSLWQEASFIDAELVATISGAGGEVIAWTVNDADDARRLGGLGVAALCGNYPERLRLR